MTPATRERRWPWYQQVVDAAFAAAGLGIALSMAYRNNFPIVGVILVAACAGKVSASQLIRLLLGRWDTKP
jgi:hypothetical protein